MAATGAPSSPAVQADLEIGVAKDHLYSATLLLNGKVLIAGGYRGNPPDGPQGTTSVEVYDPSTRKFTPTGNMTTARQASFATKFVNRDLLTYADRYE